MQYLNICFEIIRTFLFNILLNCFTCYIFRVVFNVNLPKDVFDQVFYLNTLFDNNSIQNFAF